MCGCCVVEAIAGGKISPASRSKTKTQWFPHLRRSLDTRGFRVWREEGRLIAFAPSERACWKERLQCNFLSWRLSTNLGDTFASLPRSSYVSKDTFLASAKLCKRSTHVEECKFVHKGSIRCQYQSSPTIGNYLESVSCLWSLEGRNEVRRHTLQTSVGAKTDQKASHLSIPKTPLEFLIS